MYLSMRLIEYLQEKSISYQEFASKIKAKPGYVERLAKGWQRPGPFMAMRIEEATEFQVSRSTLRPDIWPSTVVCPTGKQEAFQK